jgi:hypothetical protein
VIPTMLSVLTALFSAVGKLFEWLYARNLADAGKVLAELDALRAQVRDAQIAVAAREAARAASARDPVGMPDDPFRRD